MCHEFEQETINQFYGHKIFVFREYFLFAHCHNEQGNGLKDFIRIVQIF